MTAFEVHMFSAVALAGPATGFLTEEHHPLLIFVRQPPGTDHDLHAAATAAQDAGWSEVDITRAGTLPEGADAEMEAPVREAYRSAVEAGAGVLAFDAVVQAAPRKS